jgi:hypothetical protein
MLALEANCSKLHIAHIYNTAEKAQLGGPGCLQPI